LQAGDEIIVEWRALTVALLDELAPLVRAPGPDRDANAAGLCARRRHLGGGPCAGTALAWRYTAPEHRQRWHRLNTLNPLNIERGKHNMSNVHVIDHPLVQHKLTLMRKKDASTNSFQAPAERAGLADGL
jgi:hypothetical protein